MARNIDDIQRDIERTRRQLANTLDELANRTKPSTIANDVQSTVTSQLKQTNVQLALAGVAAVIVGGITIAVVRGRRRHKDLKELQRLLASR